MNKQMTAMELLVLRACGRMMAEFAAKKVPPKTATLTYAAWEEESLFGPKYEPRRWYGDGERISDSQRAKLLRVLHSLADRGLVVTASYRGRLERAKLTAEGLDAIGTADKPARKPRPNAGRKLDPLPTPPADVDSAPAAE